MTLLTVPRGIGVSSASVCVGPGVWNPGALCSAQGEPFTSGSEPQRQQESTVQQNQRREGSGPGLWGQHSKDLS